MFLSPKLQEHSHLSRKKHRKVRNKLTHDVLTLETTSLGSVPNKHATGTDRNAFENHRHTLQQTDKEEMSLRDTGEIAHRRNSWLCTDSQIPLLHI